MNEKFLHVALVVVAIIVLGFVGRVDYQDEVNRQQKYCKNVKSGVWPDYQKIYEKECK